MGTMQSKNTKVINQVQLLRENEQQAKLMLLELILTWLKSNNLFPQNDFFMILFLILTLMFTTFIYTLIAFILNGLLCKCQMIFLWNIYNYCDFIKLYLKTYNKINDWKKRHPQVLYVKIHLMNFLFVALTWMSLPVKVFFAHNWWLLLIWCLALEIYAIHDFC